MKAFPILSLLCIFAFAVSGAFAAPLSGEIKIGAMETLTGDNAMYGIPMKNALDLATEEINASGFLGKAKIKLIVLDDKADKQEGISVINKLITQEKVSIVIGPTLSKVAFTADPIAQKAGVPVLAHSNTAIGITAMGNYIFRDSLLEASVIPQTIAAVKAKLKAKKAAILYEVTDEFTKSAFDVFKKTLETNGITITGIETYNKGDGDFRTQLSKLKSGKPDFFVVSALIGEASPILQQAREVGIKAPIVGGNGFNSPFVIKNAKEAADGLVVGSAWFAGSTNAKSQKFVVAYKKKFGTDADQFAAQAYEALYLAATAIKNAGSSDSKAIRDALALIKNHDGVLGSFSFDANRDPVHPSVTLTVKNGAFALY